MNVVTPESVVCAEGIEIIRGHVIAAILLAPIFILLYILLKIVFRNFFPKFVPTRKAVFLFWIILNLILFANDLFFDICAPFKF